jgi:thiamine transport system permease protein
LPPTVRSGRPSGQQSLIRKLLWAIPLTFVSVLFYWPIAKITSLGFSGDWLATLSAPNTIEVIWFTLWQAAVSTLVTLVISIPGAYLLYRRSFPGQGLIKALITVPFVLPSIVVAVGFTVFRNVHDFWIELGLTFLSDPIYWIIAAHVFVNYSIAIRTIGGVWAGLDTEIDEAAELDGAGRLRSLLAISLPQLRPAVFSAAALVFLFSATSFGIVLVLGGGQVQTIETAIYFSATQFLDLEATAALVFVQTLITASAFLVGSSLAKGTVGLEQVFEGNRKPRVDRRDLPASVLTTGIVVGLLVMPMLLVLVEAFKVGEGWGLTNFANLGTRGARDLLNISVIDAAANSLRNMVVAAAISFVLGTVISWLLVRTKQKLLDLVFLVPLGVSSVVLGFGFLVSLDSSWLPLRSSWLIVPLAQTLIALPMVIRLVYPALVSIGKEPIEQASLDGATSWQIWRFVESGMIKGVLLTAAGYAAIISVGEFGASSFLAYGSEGTIPTLLFRLIARPGEQNYGMAMAVSAILILFVWGVMLSLAKSIDSVLVSFQDEETKKTNH